MKMKSNFKEPKHANRRAKLKILQSVDQRILGFGNILRQMSQKLQHNNYKYFFRALTGLLPELHSTRINTLFNKKTNPFTCI